MGPKMSRICLILVGMVTLMSFLPFCIVDRNLIDNTLIPASHLTPPLNTLLSNSDISSPLNPNVTISLPIQGTEYGRNPPEYSIAVENDSIIKIIDVYLSLNSSTSGYWYDLPDDSFNGTISKERWNKLGNGIIKMEFLVVDENNYAGLANVWIIKFNSWIPLAKKLDTITIYIILPSLSLLGIGIFYAWNKRDRSQL